MASTRHLSCLCGAIQLPICSLGSLPAPAVLCHCGACRQTSGSLCLAHLRLAQPSPGILRRTTLYATDHDERFFCTRCGCHCFRKTGDTWECSAGLVDAAPPTKVTRISRHVNVQSTFDGGLAVFLRSSNDQNIPLLNGDVNSSLFQPSTPPSTNHDSLQAGCHCGGISFSIRRNTDNHGTQSRLGSSGRFTSYFCACRSCRLSSGSTLVPFALIPVTSVSGMDITQSTLSRSAFPAPLGHIWSSPSACRTFCRGCGASIFYWNRERPDELDMAVGIFRADGAMCRSWLDWQWGRCSFTEETVDEDISRAWTAFTHDIATRTA